MMLGHLPQSSTPRSGEPGPWQGGGTALPFEPIRCEPPWQGLTSTGPPRYAAENIVGPRRINDRPRGDGPSRTSPAAAGRISAALVCVRRPVASTTEEDEMTLTTYLNGADRG